MYEPKKADDWLAALHEGDAEAYRIFFEEYYQVLGVFAMKYVHDHAVAEDAVNDVIVEMYSRRPRFDSLTALKSFLFTAVRNRCLNLARHDRAQRRYLADAAESDEFFLNAIIEEEVYFLLTKTIRTLPELPRRIYELSLGGASNEEIARELSLTVDSVKAYKKRGKQMLRERLKGLMSLLSVQL